MQLFLQSLGTAWSIWGAGLNVPPRAAGCWFSPSVCKALVENGVETQGCGNCQRAVSTWMWVLFPLCHPGLCPCTQPVVLSNRLCAGTAGSNYGPSVGEGKGDHEQIYAVPKG